MLQMQTGPSGRTRVYSCPQACLPERGYKLLTLHLLVAL